jgi:hypothetical protein
VGQGGNHVLVTRPVSLKKIRFETPELTQDVSQQLQQVGYVVAGREAVLEIAQLRSFSLVKISHKFKGTSTHVFKEAIQILLYLPDSAVGKDRGQKAGNLHVRRLGIPIDKLQRVGAYQFTAVVLFVQSLQGQLDSGPQSVRQRATFSYLFCCDRHLSP